MHPLELSPDEMKSLVRAAVDHIVRHVETLPEQPATHTRGGARLARSLAESLPEEGTPAGKLLDLIFRKAVPRSLNTAGPGYLGYIPGGGLFQSAVADLISDSVNRYSGLFMAAPGLVQLEMNVLAWFREITGLPATARGVLTSGGSMANLTALVTARRERLPENFLAGTLYVSDQTHHSVAKSALLAGFPPANVRSVPSDERFRIRLDLLEEKIEDDRQRGLTPFFVAGNAGTTNSGAVDPLPALADLAHRHNLWFHVDGAYGGFFCLTERGRKTLAGIERADSVVLDPHKGLFLPYGTGALLVRDGAALKRAHSVAADYMPALDDDTALADFCELSPELTRPFRGLRVWLPVKMHGLRAFREALDEKLDLARQAADELRTIPGIEILAEPELSLLAFRWVPPEAQDGAALDRLNKKLLERINQEKRVFLTGTRLHDRFALRICILSFRTHQDRIAMAIEDIKKAMTRRTQAPIGRRYRTQA
ncbi:MAG TPA: aminotransferase class I/II-fold pyridoxal phosphate-dependent enzyme [Thermoanaerobaculia bacterium]|jgi:aromatic-L-amino-acid decarboxylase|nr:aminotransferase class I/II-fold pyridoxal phosphate-dependent enzyme [Thermoanaerobaculia bacterium]